MTVVILGWLDLLLLSWNTNVICLRLVHLIKTLQLPRIMWKMNWNCKQDARLILYLLRTAWQGIVPSLLVGAVMVYSMLIIILSIVVRSLDTAPSTEVEQQLRLHWGSWSKALTSMYKAVTWGETWKEIAAGLEASSSFSYGIFLLYTALFNFVLVTVLFCTFIQRTMKFMHAAPYLTTQDKQARKNFFVASLLKAFEGNSEVSYEQFCGKLYCENHVLDKILTRLEVTTDDADQLFYTLSGQGNRDVPLGVFTSGCMRMTEPARKVDLLMLKDAAKSPGHIQTYVRQHQSEVSNGGGHWGTLEDIGGREPLTIRKVSKDLFAATLTNVVILDALRNDEERNDLTTTVKELVKVVLGCEGGCGFVVASYAAYKAVRDDDVDFQAVDHSAHFQKGYMTERLRGVHVGDPAFMQAMRDFSAHSEGDAWPLNHEASGLPKDGYALLSLNGYRVICAARIQGLPVTPFKWDGVGTRHAAALGTCWAFRRFPAIVLVRSERGKVHGLYHKGGKVVVYECEG